MFIGFKYVERKYLKFVTAFNPYNFSVIFQIVTLAKTK
jgi:hypothetical protein